MATEKELKERWLTNDGKERLAEVIEAAKKKEEDWAPIVTGFPYVEAVENGRGLASES